MSRLVASNTTWKPKKEGFVTVTAKQGWWMEKYEGNGM